MFIGSKMNCFFFNFKYEFICDRNLIFSDSPCKCVDMRACATNTRKLRALAPPNCAASVHVCLSAHTRSPHRQKRTLRARARVPVSISSNTTKTAHNLFRQILRCARALVKTAVTTIAPVRTECAHRQCTGADARSTRTACIRVVLFGQPRSQNRC